MISSTPPSLNVRLTMSDQSHKCLMNLVCSPIIGILSCSDSAVSILISVLTLGYSCSNVIGNLSRNASLSTLVPMNLPSSEPLPLVFAVAITLNPALGLTYSPIFFKNTPLPSSMDCKHMILLDARSISSSSKIAPLSSASMTAPLCHTVCPLTSLNPPIRSSSSVSTVMLTLISSLPVSAHACSTPNVLPLPDIPVMNTG